MKQALISIAAGIASILFTSCGTSAYYTDAFSTLDGIYYRPSLKAKEAIAEDNRQLASLVDRTREESVKLTDTILAANDQDIVLNTKPGEQYIILLDGNKTDSNSQYSLNININDGWYNGWNFGYSSWWNFGFQYNPYYWGWHHSWINWPYYDPFWGPGYWGPWSGHYAWYNPWYDPWYNPWYNPWFGYPHYHYPYYSYLNSGPVIYGKRGSYNSPSHSSGIRNRVPSGTQVDRTGNTGSGNAIRALSPIRRTSGTPDKSHANSTTTGNGRPANGGQYGTTRIDLGEKYVVRSNNKPSSTSSYRRSTNSSPNPTQNNGNMNDRTVRNNYNNNAYGNQNNFNYQGSNSNTNSNRNSFNSQNSMINSSSGIRTSTSVGASYSGTIRSSGGGGSRARR